jgi:hypothetical protein
MYQQDLLCEQAQRHFCRVAALLAHREVPANGEKLAEEHNRGTLQSTLIWREEKVSGVQGRQT